MSLSKLIRLENFVLLLIVLFTYYKLDGNWLAFALVLFTFDISMVGYLVSNSLGRVTYNLGHSYVLPSLLLLLSWNNDWLTALYVSLIWLAHISLDRTLGYGLKLQDFHHTHLGVIGNTNHKK
jgi:hypothetical protein